MKRKKMDAEARRRIAAIEELTRNMPNTRLIVVPERYSEEKK